MSRATTVGEAATLNRDLADFLIEFSIGLHKNAIYPPGHPLLDAATAGIVRRLDALLKERSTLSLASRAINSSSKGSRRTTAIRCCGISRSGCTGIIWAP